MFNHLSHPDDDWWRHFQNGARTRLASLNPSVSMRSTMHSHATWASASKRTMVRNFLHGSVQRMRDRHTSSQQLETLSRSKAQPTLLAFAPQTSQLAATLPIRARAYTSAQLPAEKSAVPVSGPRVVWLDARYESTNVAAVIASVTGGALEKVVVHDPPKNRVELHFLSPFNADRFIAHVGAAKTFSVNGSPVRVSWAPPAKGLKLGHLALPKYIRAEIDKNSASRVIVMSRPVHRGVRQKERYPDAREHFSSNFNIERLKWDLVQFGAVVEVTPMVSSKLSISVQFYDIRSAILAAHAIQLKSTLFYEKYNLWTIKYVRDVTSRPCMVD